MKTILILVIFFSIFAASYPWANGTSRPATSEPDEPFALIPITEAAPTKVLKQITKPALAPKKTREIQPLAMAAKANDICEVSRLIQVSKDQTSFAEAIGDALGIREDLAELLSTQGPYYVPEGVYKNYNSRLYQALRLGGFTEHGSSKEKWEQANTMLKKLEGEDSSNGAPLYFRIALEKRLGASEEKLREMVESLARKSSFETGENEIMKAMQGAIAESPAMLFLLENLRYNLPHFEYYETQNLINGLYPEGTSALANIRALMIEHAKRAKYGYRFFELSREQYNVGFNFGVPTNHDDVFESFPIYGPYINPALPCERGIWDEYFDQVRSQVSR